MSITDEIEDIQADEVELVEAMLGFDIRVRGERAGAIEGVPGQLEYLVVEPHWEGKGIGRAALRAFIEQSREAGHERVVTNNVTHEAMRHILETEGFSERTDAIGLEKDV